MRIQTLLCVALGVGIGGMVTAGPLLSAVSAAGPARVIEPEGGFSYVPPSGWLLAHFPGFKYRILHGPPAGGFAPNINFVDDTANVSLSDYVQSSFQVMQKYFPGFHLRSQAAFVTAAGLRGVRVVVEDKPAGDKLQQIFYLFSGRGKKKFVVTASTLASDGAKYDSVVDASVKTLILK